MTKKGKILRFPGNHAPAEDKGAEAPVVRIEGSCVVTGKELKGAQDDLFSLTERAAMRLVAEGNAKEALTLYRKAMRLYPSDHRLPLNLGQILHGQGDPQGALTAYRRSIRLRDNATARYDVGVALEDLGDEVGAITSYRRCLRLDASFADAHHNLGRLLERRGDLDLAKAHRDIYQQLINQEGSAS